MYNLEKYIINNNKFIKEYLNNKEETLNKYNNMNIYCFGHKCKITDVNIFKYTTSQQKSITYLLEINNKIITNDQIYTKILKFNDIELKEFFKFNPTYRTDAIFFKKEQIITFINLFYEYNYYNFDKLVKIYDLKESFIEEIINILENKTDFLGYIAIKLILSITFLEKHFNLYKNFETFELICKYQKLNEEFIRQYINKFNRNEIKKIIENQIYIPENLKNELKIIAKLY